MEVPDLLDVNARRGRLIAVLMALTALALLLASCGEKQPAEVAVPDYSAPRGADAEPPPAPEAPPAASDYSSPVAPGGEAPGGATPTPTPAQAPAAGAPGEPAGPHTAVPPPDQVERVRVVSHGEEIVAENYVVPGKTTIFDFYSEYCPPCVRVAPHLDKLVNGRDDLYLVTVDINRSGIVGIDWGSPVAMQFSLRKIPYFRIYGPDGKLMLDGDGAWDQIARWLRESE